MTLIVVSPTSDLLVREISRGGARFVQNSTPTTSSSNTKVTGSAAELYAKWFQISSLVRFCVSGNLGNLCFYLIERLVYYQLCQIKSLPSWVEEYKDSVSFAIGYLLQIITQHLLHAFLVYGLDTINTREKYMKTLLGQAYVYSFALVGSTVLNLFLLRTGLEKTKAFFATMVLFAIINYFLIEWVVKRVTTSSSAKNVATGNSSKTIRGGGGFVTPPYSVTTTRTNHLNAPAPVDVEKVNNEKCSSVFKRH